MTDDDLANGLGGRVVGHIAGPDWSCECGASGREPDNTRASLVLYFHRRANHSAQVKEDDE